MPHLRFRAVEPQTVQALSKPLTDELLPLMDCLVKISRLSTFTPLFQ